MVFDFIVAECNILIKIVIDNQYKDRFVSGCGIILLRELQNAIMSNTLTARVSTDIKAPAGKVWDAITDPAKIKQYLMGTDTITDWKRGSSIHYKGTWKGKAYEDKGTIIDIVPNKLLHTTYLSGMSGKEDKPENYNNVIYELHEGDGKTTVSISQDNIKDEQEQQHMKENWTMVLDGMKKVVEG